MPFRRTIDHRKSVGMLTRVRSTKELCITNYDTLGLHTVYHGCSTTMVPTKMDGCIMLHQQKGWFKTHMTYLARHRISIWVESTKTNTGS